MYFKKVPKNKLLICLLIFTLILTIIVKNQNVACAKEYVSPKNVILMIGDGMGVSYVSALRNMNDNPSTKNIEDTHFDKYLVGQQTTYPDDEKHNITDSASAATAIASGQKTFNQGIAVDNNFSETKTVLEHAKLKGKATGIVSTSEITHATPAAFVAHNKNRDNMEQIADDYFDKLINNQHKVDVLLGGGKRKFVRNDRNLVSEFIKDGYTFVSTREQLFIKDNSKVLGLFADSGLDKMIDRSDNTPSLEDMTIFAINRLKQDKDGFFLMVEGSQIDWAGHDNDIVAVMSEMKDFENAFKSAINFAKQDGQTIVIATADHSTGGLSLGYNGIYNWNTKPIKAAKKTPDYMAKKIASCEDVDDVLGDYYDMKLTYEELSTVKDAALPIKGKIDINKVDKAIESIINTRSNTGWTTSGHTGEDVNIYAYGPGSELFSGLIDNTDIAKNIFNILNYN